jgi:RNA polymerase sigma-70 factor (ECF subfamily)
MNSTTHTTDQAHTPDQAQTTAQDRLYGEATATYGAALARLIIGYEANAEKRRDLLQEIHIALWTSFANFDGRCSLRTWVYRVGHNVAVNHVVKNKRYGEGALTGLDELENVADHSDQAAGLDAKEVLAKVHKMIQQLKSPDRQIILLYLDDIDAETISQITGMSAGNVATKIHRIKGLLARQFHEERNHD